MKREFAIITAESAANFRAKTLYVYHEREVVNLDAVNPNDDKFYVTDTIPPPMLRDVYTICSSRENEMPWILR
jgi:hypothetical protein